MTTTPFSDRALDRGLSAVLVAAIRHGNVSALPNPAADAIGLTGPGTAEFLDAVQQRVERVTHDAEHALQVRAQLEDLLDAEWRLLSRPTTDRQDEDFRAVPTEDVPAGFENLLDQVVLVSRLREVQALVGFTRLNAPERRDLEPRNRVPLTRGQPDWVPAVEQRGEGVFLEFREDAVAAWARAVDQHPRLAALRDAHGRWASRRGGRADPLFPVARVLLLHTLSHLLIRQVSLQCGYSSASLRERLYIGQPGARTPRRARGSGTFASAATTPVAAILPTSAAVTNCVRTGWIGDDESAGMVPSALINWRRNLYDQHQRHARPTICPACRPPSPQLKPNRQMTLPEALLP